MAGRDCSCAPKASAHWRAVATCIILVFVVHSQADEPQHCSRQPLVRCRPADLGVVHIALIGEAFNYAKNATQTVTLRAFVKIHRTVSGETRLFGYGWIDDVHETYNFAPHQGDYVRQPLPAMTLHAWENVSWGDGVNITISYGTNAVSDAPNFAFRMDVQLNQPKANMFMLQVAGWPRAAHFSLADCHALHGLMLPWHNMSTSANAHQTTLHGPRGLPSRRQVHKRSVSSQVMQVPPEASPIVGVLCIGRAETNREWFVFQAQNILRHVEYHIAQAGMQRMLLYIRESFYALDILRDYLATHMPPNVRPYVTFVIWNEVPYIEESLFWDQIMTYYHANVALSGYAHVMGTYIDLDEYIAWPKPAQSLHEALARCNTSNLDAIGLTSMYTLCAGCDYNNTHIHAERKWWASVESPAAIAARTNTTLNRAAEGTNGTYCRWYKEDPLSQYTRTWDDSWMEKNAKKTWADRAHPQLWLGYGKIITRVRATKTFIMHRAELMPGHNPQTYLDPESCPYIAHLYNILYYRGHDTRGGLQWFAKNWTSNWWIIPGH